jgi:Domain of unknown function (DUF4129)
MQTQLPSGPQVSRALERVYARPELAPREPGLLDGVREAIGRVLARIGEFLARFFALRTESPPVFYGVLVVLVAIGLAIVVYFILNTLARLRDSDAPARPPRAPFGAVDARVRSAAEWEEAARRAAAAGHFREAAVALYQALLLRLETAGALRYDPAKTPGDYRREARRDPRAAGALTAFLRGFEPAVFGGRALDAAGYDRLRGAAGEAGAHG